MEELTTLSQKCVTQREVLLQYPGKISTHRVTQVHKLVHVLLLEETETVSQALDALESLKVNEQDSNFLLA